MGGWKHRAKCPVPWWPVFLYLCRKLLDWSPKWTINTVTMPPPVSQRRRYCCDNRWLLVKTLMEHSSDSSCMMVSEPFTLRVHTPVISCRRGEERRGEERRVRVCECVPVHQIDQARAINVLMEPPTWTMGEHQLPAAYWHPGWESVSLKHTHHFGNKY